MKHGLSNFEGLSPEKRAHLSPDTEVDLHCCRRAARCLWWCTPEICDEKCWSQIAWSV